MKGLAVNARKCASLRVLPVKGKKSKVVTSTHRYWGIVEIPSITFDDLLKYLGVQITPTGNVQLPRKTWEDYLQNFTKSHFNPIQKVQAISQVVTAKLQYHLRLSDHGLEEVRKINRLVRKYVKKILHLPTWVSNAWIHHREGCNITDFCSFNSSY